MDIISEENYINKTYHLISKNKSLINVFGNLDDDQISLNTNFIISHKNSILRNIFGKDDELSMNESKKNFSNENSKRININNINNINAYSSKIEEIQYLNKKRKSHRNHILKGLRYNNKNNSINSSEEKYDESYINKLSDKEDEGDKQKKDKKEETISEKEILSQIEEENNYLSLLSDNGLLKETESKKNNSQENDEVFIKNLLLKYQNGDILKSYLNMINNDNGEFKNSIKSLIYYKNSLNDKSSSDKLIEKFSIMNKIFLIKEKSNILIDKIVVKLKQLILEYNFIKKVLNNIDENKSDKFQSFREIATNINNNQDKKDYINEASSLIIKILNMDKENEKN